MPKAIAKLRVEGLFGQFDYEFPKAGTQDSLPSDLLILYGDNGSGKTTLLNLIFHALSPANNRGHRNAIRRIPFKRFELTLTDGSKIALSRDTELVGGYWVYAERPGRSTVQTNFSIQRARKFASEEHEREFISFLKRTGQSVYFVGADRRISSDELAPPDTEPDLEAEHHDASTDEAGRVYFSWARISDRIAEVRPETLRGPSLIQATELAKNWITQHVLRAARRGTGSTHGIYAQVVKNIATSARAGDDSAGQGLVDDLTNTLESLSARSKSYARFGFAPELSAQEMVEAIRGAHAHDVPLIASVLKPYVESTSATFQELEPVYKITSLLIDSLAAFYAHKSVTFSLNQGFAVRNSQDNKRIDPTWLSSGEQQLLLLFCYALVCSDRDSIFIVDEPELSLNVKWQRRLIQSLLDIVSGGRVQFVFASHSIELIAEHLEKVLELEAGTASPSGLAEAETRIGQTHNS